VLAEYVRGRAACVLAFSSLFFYNCDAASFDCEKKLSQIEDAICADRALSDLDEALQKSYGQLMRMSAVPNTLKADQRRWLTQVRNQCNDMVCLAEAYRERISELESRWEKQVRDSHERRGEAGQSKTKPFEGNWKACSLYRGDEICSSYLLVQSGERVCGEWEYWATSRIYDGRLQARAQGERATVELICGRPGGETQTECAYENEAEEAWEKAKGGLAVCEGLLYATQTEMPCSAAKSAGSFFGFNALTNNQRKEILSQPWVKKCLSGER
jgi:uncharacterized protein